MKILAINSSPRVGGQSKTEHMLNHLVEGIGLMIQLFKTEGAPVRSAPRYGKEIGAEI